MEDAVADIRTQDPTIAAADAVTLHRSGSSVPYPVPAAATDVYTAAAKGKQATADAAHIATIPADAAVTTE